MITTDTLPIPADDYHQLPGVSNSKLSVLIEDPREYHYRFLSGEYREKPQGYFDFGTAVHEVALLGDASRIAVPPASVLSSSGSRAGKAWYAWKSENEGCLILKQSELDSVNRCVDVLRAHSIAGPLLESIGYTERLYQYDDSCGLTVRARPDKLCQWNGKNVVLDIKTTANTTAASFVRSVADFGYDRQEYVYRKVLAKNDVCVDAFIFIAVKKTAPFTVDCYSIRDDWIASAGVVVEQALVDLVRRLRDDDWKAVTHNSVVELSPPNWLKYRGEYIV